MWPHPSSVFLLRRYNTFEDSGIIKWRKMHPQVVIRIRIGLGFVCKKETNCFVTHLYCWVYLQLFSLLLLKEVIEDYHMEGQFFYMRKEMRARADRKETWENLFPWTIEKGKLKIRMKFKKNWVPWEPHWNAGQR